MSEYLTHLASEMELSLWQSKTSPPKNIELAAYVVGHDPLNYVVLASPPNHEEEALLSKILAAVKLGQPKEKWISFPEDFSCCRCLIFGHVMPLIEATHIEPVIGRYHHAQCELLWLPSLATLASSNEVKKQCWQLLKETFLTPST